MSSISGISSASSAWSNMSAMRGNRPPGGMDPAKMFAKVDADGSGSVDKTELQSLLDDVAQKTGVSNSSSTDALFSQIDSDGDGSLTQTEFEAGRPQGGNGPQGAGGMPPPPPPGGAMGSKGADSTSYDPLDTNQDGVVSAEERMAANTGNDSLQDLFKAIDTDGDSTISSTESEAFIQELTAQYNAASTSAQEKARSDLSQLVMRAYQQIASGLSPQSRSSSLNALA